MSNADDRHAQRRDIDGLERYDIDTAPGDEYLGDTEVGSGLRGYVIGLGLATLLTIASFWLPGTNLIWAPGIPVALVVLAIAQMGVHLVFFLHITTGPDNTNNSLALAFGVLIVVLVIGGSIWIMANLDHNLMPMNANMHVNR
ncbi:cytochrome o ubiquinol oxidase subunit IV [Mesorhizobium sp. ISC25]|uniref:cytochrome o ubiquinol oxidase subunit IV n=1 Tax=Mesorhizobium sp. ISC25 TaxID=3077335 RepID=UPI0035E0828B